MVFLDLAWLLSSMVLIVNFDYLDMVYMKQRSFSDYSKEELDSIFLELKKLVEEFVIEFNRENFLIKRKSY